jgi:hypothetical protein
MHIRRAISNARRLVGAPWRPAKPPTPSLRDRPEFPQVNARAGIEPIQPELSGLALRAARIPRRATRVLIRLAYRWHPSAEYRRRQLEIRLMNVAIRQMHGEPELPPPVLAYEEHTTITPTRLQPMLEPIGLDEAILEVRHDLTRAEEEEQLRRATIIQPRLAGADPEYLLSYRPLLPRRYRHFLRSSPYPRIAAGLTAAAVAVSGFLWVSQTQEETAAAAGQARVVRHTFEAQLLAARRDGVEPRLLRPLRRQARALGAVASPSGLIPTRSRVLFYRGQVDAYAALLHDLRRLEHRALIYWRGKETGAYAALVEATQTADGAGLPAGIPDIPACSTPGCYHTAVISQRARAAWLRQAAATLHAYAATILDAPDPYADATSAVQAADNLVTLLPRSALPIPVPRLDAAYASAGDNPAYARAGALAHLDRDVLLAGLVRHLQGRAVIVSTESGTLICYRGGKAVFRTPVTAGSATPTGRFHIQSRVPSVSATYWNRSGAYTRYRTGVLPDWMPFSGDAALQGAPWRLAFGPGSEGAVAAYVPDTPSSIDLPVHAADWVYSWTKTGTEVVVY